MAIVNAYLASITVVGGVFVWLVATTVYRYFFHPLRKYPGPVVNAVSGIPAVVGLLSGRQHAYVKGLHDKYGPVVRIAPNELSFISDKAWEDIYGFRTSDEPLEKDPVWVGALVQKDGIHPMTYAPRQIHARQRRAFSHPFSNTSCLQQEPLIQGHIDNLMKRLGEHHDAGKPVNLKNWYMFYTLDVIGDLCFGAPFGCLEAGTGTEWSRSLMKAMRCGTYDQATRRIAGAGTWLQKKMAHYLIPKEYQDGKMSHYINSSNKVVSRLEDTEKDHKDFVYYILRSNEAKKLLSTPEIIINSSVFIAAGSDTTAATLLSLTYLILTNEDAYKRLVTEIRSRFASPEEIVWANVKDLPFLPAVINETLRFFMPVTTGLLRKVPPKSKGIEIDGNFVPGGTTVSVHLWTSSHSEYNWTRPYDFLPDRWLHPENFPHDKRGASQPFSMGPRGCIGKNLSHIEMRLVVCQVLWAYDLELEGGRKAAWQWEPEGELKNITTYLTFERPDLMVRLKKVVRE